MSRRIDSSCGRFRRKNVLKLEHEFLVGETGREVAIRDNGTRANKNRGKFTPNSLMDPSECRHRRLAENSQSDKPLQAQSILVKVRSAPTTSGFHFVNVSFPLNQRGLERTSSFIFPEERYDLGRRFNNRPASHTILASVNHKGTAALEKVISPRYLLADHEYVVSFFDLT